jgi:hypothetical protein
MRWIEEVEEGVWGLIIPYHFFSSVVVASLALWRPHSL